MSVLVIAEAGVNHNGSLQTALALVDAAATAGADVIKFQTFRADSLVTAQAPTAHYQRDATGVESQLALLASLEMSRDAHVALIQACARRGIRFLSTPFDAASVDLLDELGVDSFKVPSGEITNLPHLRHVGGLGKPVILSTGMATLTEIAEALDVLAVAGTPRSRVTVLHCTSEYPAPMSEVNLRAISTIRETFDVAVGYSDHTTGLEVAVAAVTLGASIIEKHLTLDRHLPGPDHQASLEPEEFAAMVSAIRNIEKALGDGVKQPTISEGRNRLLARKSLVAACAIQAGEVFSEKNIAAKRPGTGISPMCWDEVLGRTARRSFVPDELIDLAGVE